MSQICKCGHSVDSHYLLSNMTIACSQLNNNLLLKLAGISWCMCNKFEERKK